MKVFMAGNMPGRVPEEKKIIRKGIIHRRLFSYFFLMKEIQMKKTFDIWSDRRK